MRRLHFIIAFLLLATTCSADPIKWKSLALGREINMTIIGPARWGGGPQPVAIYLEHLSTPRLGREADEAIVKDLGDDMCVLILDYEKDEKAKSPDLAADVLELRKELTDSKKPLLADRSIDASCIYFLAEGCRLKRNVEFVRDGDRVLAFDVIYPSDPEKPVPALLEFSCDNANRMGSSSLLFCHDTLIENGMLQGFAVAMADHPVAPPFKGIDDPMPASLDRARAAIVELRSMSGELHTTGKVGVMGFSRGATFAAMLACEGDVDAALVHGNRFNYLELMPNDPMLARFEKAWGPVSANHDAWKMHGALAYLNEDKCAPMFLNTSDKESAEYQDGLVKLEAALTDHGIDHVYRIDRDGRGHRVSTDPARLAEIFEFFHKHL